MREFRIQVKEAHFRALVDLALQERRAPRDQAAVLLERAIQQAARARQPVRERSDGGVLVLAEEAREVAACAS